MIYREIKLKCFSDLKRKQSVFLIYRMFVQNIVLVFGVLFSQILLQKICIRQYRSFSIEYTSQNYHISKQNINWPHENKKEIPSKHAYIMYMGPIWAVLGKPCVTNVGNHYGKLTQWGSRWVPQS